MADDKLVHSYVDRIVRFYLGEEPLLPSVPSYDLAERRSAEVLEQLVVKPRGEMGGEGVVIWRAADAETRTRVWREIERDPAAFVGQELVTLSVPPTVCDGRLEPRHVDLRPRGLQAGGARVLPAGISRVALERGSMIVNSGQGGGAKDTWLPEGAQRRPPGVAG